MLSDPIYQPEWTVAEALEVYFSETGFSKETYENAWTQVDVGWLRLWVPNTKAHRWAIMRHDLHHVATGFGTDLIGEGEISAWEVRRGLQHLSLYVKSIVRGGALTGLLLSPSRILAAWRAGEGEGTLMDPSRDYERLLDMRVGELRETLGLPRDGLAKRRAHHSAAPARTNV